MTHFIHKCRECGTVLAQCRCPANIKETEFKACPGGSVCPKNSLPNSSSSSVALAVPPPITNLAINLGGNNVLLFSINEHGRLCVTLPEGMSVDEAAAKFIAALQTTGLLPTAAQLRDKR